MTVGGKRQQGVFWGAGVGFVELEVDSSPDFSFWLLAFDISTSLIFSLFIECSNALPAFNLTLYTWLFRKTTS